jgi:biopolymer transport protein ExbD
LALRFAKPEVRRARIELVPMIDTMAFLLIFFMVASLAMSRQMGLAVNLPKAGSAAEQRWADRALVITLSAGGEVYLNKKRVALRALEGELKQRLERRPDLVVVINADGRLTHERVVGVMDAAKRAGARRLAIATKPIERSEAGR